VDLVGIEPTTSSMPWKRAPSCATGPQADYSIFMEQLRFVNEAAIPARTPALQPLTAQPMPTLAAGQPGRKTPHRAADMPVIRIPLTAAMVAVAVCLPVHSFASAQAAAPPPSTVSNTMRPALAQVQQTLNSINVRKWKAPNAVRDEVGGDVTAIQRDLNGTLANLLQQADAAPTSIPAAFAVYRNVDALYDTLLRVVETAELAAPDPESNQLEATLKTLENARASLGDAILTGSQREQAEVVRLRTSLASANAELERKPAKTNVIEDGPAPAKPHHRTTTKKSQPDKTKSGNPSQSTTSQPH
jgi:hypothetical protein